MIKTAKKAAIEAGKILKANFRKIKNTDIIEKSKNDFLTFVDTQAEEKIIEIIQSEHNNHSILAEESGEINNNSDYSWIIDPLDGTKNYICGIPVFAVSIAFREYNQTICAVVLDVMQNDLYFVERGKGAYLNNIKLQVSSVDNLENSFLATGFPFKEKQFLNKYINTFKDIFNECAGMRRMGAAAIDLAYVAAGHFEAYWELGLKPWDMAAGDLLVAEAGGKTTDFWNEPNHFLNSFIVASNNKIHFNLIEIIKKYFPEKLNLMQKEYLRG